MDRVLGEDLKQNDFAFVKNLDIRETQQEMFITTLSNKYGAQCDLGTRAYIEQIFAFHQPQKEAHFFTLDRFNLWMDRFNIRPLLQQRAAAQVQDLSPQGMQEEPKIGNVNPHAFFSVSGSAPQVAQDENFKTTMGKK